MWLDSAASLRPDQGVGEATIHCHGQSSLGRALSRARLGRLCPKHSSGLDDATASSRPLPLARWNGGTLIFVAVFGALASHLSRDGRSMTQR